MYMCVMCDTTIQNFEVGKVLFLNVLKRGFLCSLGLHLFDKKNTGKTVILQNIITI